MRAAAGGAALGLTVVATCLVIVGTCIALLLNPVWVGFEQGRSDVVGLTGYTPEQVRSVTGSILSDLVFGPPDFDVTVNGVAVLTDSERGHMADVRQVFGLAGAVLLVAGMILAAMALAWRGSPRFWRAVRTGGLVAMGVVAVVGSLSFLFFDAAFELMHRLFFASGTYMFDPRSSRLVQLFPDQFWFETAMVLGVAILALGAVVALVAGYLARRRMPASAMGEGSAGS